MTAATWAATSSRTSCSTSAATKAISRHSSNSGAALVPAAGACYDRELLRLDPTRSTIRTRARPTERGRRRFRATRFRRSRINPMIAKINAADSDRAGGAGAGQRHLHQPAVRLQPAQDRHQGGLSCPARSCTSPAATARSPITPRSGRCTARFWAAAAVLGALRRLQLPAARRHVHLSRDRPPTWPARRFVIDTTFGNGSPAPVALSHRNQRGLRFAGAGHSRNQHRAAALGRRRAELR